MRALLAAAAAAALLVPQPAAQARPDPHHVAASCTTAPVEVLFDRTGVTATVAEARADGEPRAVSTGVECTVTTPMISGSQRLREEVPGGTVATAGAAVVSGDPTVCVRAWAYFADGVSLATATSCAFGTSASVEAGS
jgi:hypothetical protein